MSRALEVDIVRLRNLPQTEYDPLPCTTQVRATLWNDEQTEAISTEQNSSVQQQNNMPYFNDKILVPLTDVEVSGTLLFSIWEFSREDEPYVLFYAKLPVSLQAFKSKKEVIIALTSKDSIAFPVEAKEEEEEALKLGDSAPSLIVKVLMPPKKEEVKDLYADVAFPLESVTLNGEVNIIPDSLNFVWMRLLLDKGFSERYRRKLVADWNKRAPLEIPEEKAVKKKKRDPKKSVSTRKDGREENNGKEMKNIGDIILLRWCSHRPHQVLNRVRLTAEKFIRSSEELLIFTPEEELAYREEKKKRSILVSRMCMDSIFTTGKNLLRDWMERLWVLYCIGIDNDPSGTRVLSFELRQKVSESTFELDDAIILHASMLNLLLPALTYEKCQELVEDDAKNSPDVVFQEKEGFEQKVTVYQRYFTQVLGDFLGNMVDTLAEAELTRFCKELKAAVFDAHQRVQTKGKEGIRGRVRPNEVGKDGSPTGSGIKIEHLDKYGHRKKVTYFA